MDVTTTWWVGTLAVVCLLLLTDLVLTSRQNRRPTSREASLGVAFYCGTAVAFGILIWVAFGARYGGEFAAGWLTEYSLSVDNLFVFMVLMGRFSVPPPLQLRVLTIGIVLALVLRGTLIAAGSAAITAFSWVFYIFGAFLLWTAWKLLREGPGGEEAEESTKLVTLLQRHLRTTKTWHGGRLTVRENGRRVLTPMLVVMIAIGMTDVLFALDSIPAIFGLTKEAFLVVSANAFALMGLRQLYFLVEGLLDRLVHLAHGLAVVLGFIAVKLILEALHDNDLPFLNGGRHIEWAPVIPVWASLAFVLGTLAVTAVTSLISDRRAATKATKAAKGSAPGASAGTTGSGTAPTAGTAATGKGETAPAAGSPTTGRGVAPEPREVPTSPRRPTWKGATATGPAPEAGWPLRFRPEGEVPGSLHGRRGAGSPPRKAPPPER
jgi:tellurite resistance protein TerC